MLRKVINMSLIFPEHMVFEIYTEADFIQKIEHQAVFILAESVLNEHVPDMATQYGDDDLTCLYWGRMAEENPFISPYCLPVTQENWPQFKSLIVNQKGWGILLFLDPRLSALSRYQQQLELIRHLREWTLVSRPEGENQVFRMSDFTNMQTLLSVSSLHQAQALFGPVSQISYAVFDNENVDETVEFNALTLTNKDPEFKAVHRSPQVFSESQYGALQQIAVNTQHTQYQQHLNSQHAETLQWSNQEMHNFIEQQIELAQSHGFNNLQDRIRFLSLSVIFGHDFVHEPWAQAVLKNKKATGSERIIDKLHNAALVELG